MEKPLTGRFRKDGKALGIDEYRNAGGYEGLRKALKEMSPGEVVEAVKDSGLQGRGGAGFPTGQKWEFMPRGEAARRPAYFICNADEMEPGTLKDRILMEGDPHQLIEGMVIAAHAVGAQHAYIFLRWEYHEAARRLEKAIGEAYSHNMLGRDIMGSGFDLDLHLHRSAGRYMCGEETTMISALEGKRPFPRFKPPHTQQCGLWGRSSVTNNAETICNVPHIVLKGPEWYKGLSRSEEGGTKVYAVSGRVKRPGAWELPMGTTLRELIEEHAGGMREGCSFRAAIPGGASTEFIVEEGLDVKMDFGSVPSVGSRLGTGNVIVMDDKVCPVGVVFSLMSFFARESCGWCTPCREGLPWITRIVAAIHSGTGEMDDMEVLRDYSRHLWMGRTFCLLAPGAMEPLRSALKYFEDDFKRHITEKRCPWGERHVDDLYRQ
ncbi:MAG: NADH-quinone oxidoreductase subunit NuoF [Nitrospirota bacterium]|jgi:NADH-quinone oxidoreductase subunit F